MTSGALAAGAPAVLIAAVQICATADRKHNLACVREMVRSAAQQGAEVICLPEMWPFIGRDAAKVAGAETLAGPSVSAMRELAAQLGVWIFAGSFAEQSDEPGRVYNTAPVIDASGELVAVYRKLHLFDIDMTEGPTFLESATVRPGNELVVVDSPLGPAGLTVCYDLRFPLLYELLRQAGARVFMVPAAFTAHTGRAHWELLLRARAIEQQCWVVAIDQCGHHNRSRESFGHSMVVDPWGTVQASLSDQPGLLLAHLDGSRTERIRGELPAIEHRRPLGNC